MAHREYREDPERRVEEHEEERSEGAVHEIHSVREEAFGADEVQKPEIVRYETGRTPARSGYSGADREEILDTHEDQWSFATRVLNTFALWVGVWLVVMEVLLALRLVFGLSAANPAAGFVAFIYGSTGWMVAPFQGIGPNGAILGGGVFEPATLAAMLIYPLLAVVIIVVLRAIAASPRRGRSYMRRASRRRTL